MAPFRLLSGGRLLRGAGSPYAVGDRPGAYFTEMLSRLASSMFSWWATGCRTTSVGIMHRSFYPEYLSLRAPV